MHEASIVQALLDRVETEAAARHAVSVARVVVCLGDRCGVEPELFERAFDLFRAGTCAAAAALAIERRPARWECGRCRVAIADGAVLRCPTCEAPARLIAGDEIVLQRIEMEVP